MPRIERGEPPYLQVARRIRDDIVSGRLAEGEKIPSARQLATDYGIALATATKALSTLRSEGLVRGVSGVGTIVAAQESLYRSARDRTMSVLKTGRIYPEGHYAKILSSELVTAPDHVADALGLEPGALAIRRQRTTYNSSDAPLSTSISWFDGALAEVAPLLMERERILQGTARYVEERTGRGRSPDEKLIVSAGGANEEEARELRVPVSSPVLRGRNFYWDTSGAVIEYGQSAAREGMETVIEYTTSEEGR